MSSPYQPVQGVNPADLEPTASDPIVGHYAQDLTIALQRAASLGLVPPETGVPGTASQGPMPGLHPARTQQSGVADMVSGIGNFISGLNPFSPAANYYPSLMHPDYGSFNERFTRTPGTVVPNLPAGIDAQYIAGPGYPGDPGNPPGTILIKPDAGSNTISHEAAHALYNQAGLYQWAPKFEDKMNPAISEMIRSSPHYQRAIAQDPSAFTDEGLGYAMNSPVPADEAYVNAVAGRIEDPVLKQRLLMLFQHAKAMSDRGFIPLKTKERSSTKSRE